MKNLMMIEYIANLLNLIHMKMKGKQINNSSCVNRLAELRCVMISIFISIFLLFRFIHPAFKFKIIEKSKSIEVKLKYQIDKLLKIAVSQDLSISHLFFYFHNSPQIFKCFFFVFFKMKRIHLVSKQMQTTLQTIRTM